MYACPWCGTQYLTFQPNCQNCGAPLPAVKVEEIASSLSSGQFPMPPAAPRPISDRYGWRLLFADGWAIVALVFCLLGFIFSIVGLALTLGRITAFVGIPFLLLGLAFLVSSGGLLGWRYQKARQVVRVLREGDSTLGQISAVQQNYSVRVNGRYPWIIGYDFQVNGQTYAGMVTTLNQPGTQLQVGKAVWILYLATNPQLSSIYPHP